MQLSRVLFLTPEKTYERKIKETILAFQIEKNFTKEEIFTLYCNQVYFGHGNYGVEATSQFLFSKSIKDLTLAEAALIAGPAPEPLAPVAARAARSARCSGATTCSSGWSRRSTSRSEEAEQAKAEPLEPPPAQGPAVDRALLPGGGAQVPGARVRQPAHLPGRPAGLHHARPRAAARRPTRALRKGLRAPRPPARGFVPSPAIVLKDGQFPARSTSTSGTGRIRRGRRGARRGAGLGPHAGRGADRRVPRARRARADIAWTRRTSVADALPRGARRALPDRVARRRRRAQGGCRSTLEQEPKLEGALLALDATHGRGEGHGGRLRLRAQQVQPRHPGLPAGGLGLQADRLRGGPREGGLHAVHHHRGRAHLLPRQAAADAGRPTTTTTRSGARSRCGARSSRAGTSPPSRRCSAWASRPASSTRTSWALPASCRPTCRSPSARARPRSWR